MDWLFRQLDRERDAARERSAATATMTYDEQMDYELDDARIALAESGYRECDEEQYQDDASDPRQPYTGDPWPLCQGGCGGYALYRDGQVQDCAVCAERSRMDAPDYR